MSELNKYIKSIDKTNINVGDVVEFKIKMENKGNATANNLTLVEPIPKGFALAEGSRFPSVINAEFAAGASQEFYYALILELKRYTKSVKRRSR